MLSDAPSILVPKFWRNIHRQSIGQLSAMVIQWMGNSPLVRLDGSGHGTHAGYLVERKLDDDFVFVFGFFRKCIILFQQ